MVWKGRAADLDMRWVVVPCKLDVMIGKSSADIALQKTLEVEGSRGFGGYE
jgi:hypothetical protein